MPGYRSLFLLKILSRRLWRRKENWCLTDIFLIPGNTIRGKRNCQLSQNRSYYFQVRKSLLANSRKIIIETLNICQSFLMTITGSWFNLQSPIKFRKRLLNRSRHANNPSYFMIVFLKVWSMDQRHWPRSFLNMQILCLTPELLNLKFWGWGLATCVV